MTSRTMFPAAFILLTMLFRPLPAPAQEEAPQGKRLKEMLNSGRVSRDKRLADQLVDLLQAGKVQEFNKLRQAHVAEWINLSDRKEARSRGFSLENLDLKGIDLSRFIFGPVSFSGSDLREAIFRESYLVGATMQRPRSLEEPLSRDRLRLTRLDKADFRGAVLFEGPASVEEAREMMDDEDLRNAGSADFSYVDISGATFDDPMPRINDEGCELLRKAANGTLDGYFRSAVGTDIASGGTEMENPLRAVADTYAEAWKKAGLDLERAKKMKCVRIDGHFAGAGSQDFVGADPDLLLVLGEGFYTHGNITTAGPVLALGEAGGGTMFVSGTWIFFSDESRPPWRVFAPQVMIGPNVHAGGNGAVASPVVHGSFGLAPSSKDDWIRRVLKELPLEEAYQRLRSSSYDSPLYVDDVGRPTRLSEILSKEDFEALIKDKPDLAEAQGIELSGEHFGSRSRDVVGRDAKVVTVIGPKFSSHDSVFCAGPIIIVGAGGAKPWVQVVASQSWVRQIGRHRCERVVALDSSGGVKASTKSVLEDEEEHLIPEVADPALLKKLLAEKSIEDCYKKCNAFAEMRPPTSLGECGQPRSLKELLKPEDLESLVKQHPEIADAQGVLLEGEKLGAGAIDILGTDSKLVTVAGPGFKCHGMVFSAGPVVVLGDEKGTGPWVRFIATKRWIGVIGKHRCYRTAAAE
ncbi:MAG: pentapeptide repeat-containing protein [Planctomycetes bacterium]|nr:pentapeptide repeat-containing protein [Planctomycetota bacterium]